MKEQFCKALVLIAVHPSACHFLLADVRTHQVEMPWGKENRPRFSDCKFLCPWPDVQPLQTTLLRTLRIAFLNTCTAGPSIPSGIEL